MEEYKVSRELSPTSDAVTSGQSPRKWEARLYDERNAPDQRWICDVGGQYNVADEVDAEDASLIAAAPELLEALEDIVEEKADYMRRNNLGDPEKEHTIKRARAAISKAKA